MVLPATDSLLCNPSPVIHHLHKMKVNCESEAICLQAVPKGLAFFSLGVFPGWYSLLQQWVGAFGTGNPFAALGHIDPLVWGSFRGQGPHVWQQPTAFLSQAKGRDKIPLWRVQSVQHTCTAPACYAGSLVRDRNKTHQGSSTNSRFCFPEPPYIGSSNFPSLDSWLAWVLTLPNSLASDMFAFRIEEGWLRSPV